jgi:hypothetical protein
MKPPSIRAFVTPCARVFLTCVWTPGPGAAAAEFVLVDKGASMAPIIVPKDATLFTKLAA